MFGVVNLKLLGQLAPAPEATVVEITDGYNSMRQSGSEWNDFQFIIWS